jgi:hypothetical protein
VAGTGSASIPSSSAAINAAPSAPRNVTALLQMVQLLFRGMHQLMSADLQ